MSLAYVAMTVVILGSVVALAMYFQGPRRNSTDVLPPDATATYAGSEALPDMETMAKAVGTSTISYRVDDDGITCRSDGAFTLGTLLAAFGACSDHLLARAGAKVY